MYVRLYWVESGERITVRPTAVLNRHPKLNLPSISVDGCMTLDLVILSRALFVRSATTNIGELPASCAKKCKRHSN